MPVVILSLFINSLAACAEIAGCFSVWAYIRLGKSPLWLVPGGGCLILFSALLTFSPSDHAGRAYALYGGIYIVMSLIWGWLFEGQVPDRWDVSGAVLCLLGAAIILLAPHERG